MLFLTIAVCAKDSAMVQKEPKYDFRYLALNSGFGGKVNRDRFNSALLYSGPAFTIGFRIERESKRILETKSHQLELGFAGSAYGWGNLGLDYHYRMSHMWKKRCFNNADFFLGYHIGSFSQNRFNIAFVNNNYTYEMGLNSGLAARMEKVFTVRGMPLLLIYQLELPILGYYLRPTFAGSYLEGMINVEEVTVSSIINSGRLLIFNRWKSFNSAIAIRKQIKNSNALQLTWNWDYFRSSLRDLSVGSDQFLVLSLMMNI